MIQSNYQLFMIMGSSYPEHRYGLNMHTAFSKQINNNACIGMHYLGRMMNVSLLLRAKGAIL